MNDTNSLLSQISCSTIDSPSLEHESALHDTLANTDNFFSSMLDYILIRSSRRTLAIQIDKTGRLIVRAPIRMSVDLIERFIEAKDSWIQKHKKLAEERKEKAREKQEYSDRDIHEMKARLMNYLSTRVPELWD